MLFIQEARFVVGTKGVYAAPRAYFSLVSAFVLVVLSSINNALSRVGSPAPAGWSPSEISKDLALMTDLMHVQIVTHMYIL